MLKLSPPYYTLRVSMRKHHHQGVYLCTKVTKCMEVNSTLIYSFYGLLLCTNVLIGLKASDVTHYYTASWLSSLQFS
jgi:hypothetical protein